MVLQEEGEGRFHEEGPEAARFKDDVGNEV